MTVQRQYAIRFFVPWMLWWAVGVHVIFAAALLGDSKASGTGVFLGLHQFTQVGMSRTALAMMLILAAVSASWALIHETSWSRARMVIYLTPQFLILVVAFFTDLWILLSGEYNNSSFSRWLAAGVLCPSMTAAVLHTLSILERYTDLRPITNLLEAWDVFKPRALRRKDLD